MTENIKKTRTLLRVRFLEQVTSQAYPNEFLQESREKKLQDPYNGTSIGICM